MAVTVYGCRWRHIIPADTQFYEMINQGRVLRVARIRVMISSFRSSSSF